MKATIIIDKIDEIEKLIYILAEIQYYKNLNDNFQKCLIEIHEDGSISTSICRAGNESSKSVVRKKKKKQVA